MMLGSLYYLLLFLVFLKGASSYTIAGELITDKPWVFLDKFCFNPATSESPGVFDFDFVYPRNSTMVLLVYWYADSQWKEIYHGPRALTCQEKMSKADENGNKFNIYKPQWRVENKEEKRPRNIFSSYLDLIEKQGVVLAHSKGKLTFSSNRERWYYFALSNCDSTCVGKYPNHCNGEIITTYKLSFTNGAGWDRLVTSDVQGLAESSIAMFTFWICIACCVLTFQLASMSRRRMLHTTVKILVQALVWHILELFFAVIYYTNNVDTGRPSLGLRILYRICSAISETEIVLLLILLGKGWTVVRRKISAQGRVRITAFITIYSCVQFAVVTWEATVGSDPADITYLYESPPGFVLLGLRLYALIWFLRAILITRVKYTKKRGFYWKFAVLGSLWMIALPFQVGLAVMVIPVHQRPKFVFAFTIVLNMFFFVGMFYLFSPSRFNRAFPFHAKTSDMEARPPASTRRSGQGQQQQRSTGMPSAGSGGIVEMTSNGPIFRSRPSNDSGTRNGSTGGGRSTLSGGLAMSTPEERVRFSIQKIRTKISQLADHSDDLEYALDEMDLHEWDSPNVKDSDYDLPNSRGDVISSGGSNVTRGSNSGESHGSSNGSGSHGSSNDSGSHGSSTSNSKKKSKRPRPPPMD